MTNTCITITNISDELKQSDTSSFIIIYDSFCIYVTFFGGS